MSAGDLVIGQSGTGSVVYQFQPAVGVEIMVTWVPTLSLTSFGFTNGTNISISYGAYNHVTFEGGKNCKLGINNTHYFYVNANSTFGGFTGIQIK